jgi:hypothetical protein
VMRDFSRRDIVGATSHPRNGMGRRAMAAFCLPRPWGSNAETVRFVHWTRRKLQRRPLAVASPRRRERCGRRRSRAAGGAEGPPPSELRRTAVSFAASIATWDFIFASPNARPVRRTNVPLNAARCSRRVGMAARASTKPYARIFRTPASERARTQKHQDNKNPANRTKFL